MTENNNLDNYEESTFNCINTDESVSTASGNDALQNIDKSDATSVFKVGETKIPNKSYIYEDNESEKPSKRKKRKKNYTVYIGIVLATLVVCISILLALFIIVVGRDVLGIESNDNMFTVYIPEGSSTSDIADILYDEGVIQYKKVFVALSKMKDADGNMCPGDIEVAYNMSYSDIIDGLMEMREARQTKTITFPEGTTLFAAAKILEENEICSAEEFIYTFNSSVFGFEFEKYVSSSSLKLYKYEGYMFPDTYDFYVDDTAYNIVKKIKTRTNQILNDEVISRASQSGFTLEQVVTLASIVQKEAGSIEDMKPIASVFINRLNAPESYPRLQSDTTYSYIELIKDVLTVEYQDMYDAYDTYTCAGLPIGPICNPGKDAIEAVLSPSDTQYYYFCSNIDTKETYFARTYDEHKANLKIAGLEE